MIQEKLNFGEPKKKKKIKPYKLNKDGYKYETTTFRLFKAFNT